MYVDIEPEGIKEKNRISIGIEVDICFRCPIFVQKHWICAHPPRQPWRVVPRPVVVQPTLLIALLASEAVALAGKTAKAGFAVRSIFLAVDPRAIAADHHVA